MLQDIPVISRVKDISTEAKTSLYLMDVEKLLDALPVEPLFDLVVTSPPYNIGKEYENQMPLDEYVAWQKRILEKISRYEWEAATTQHKNSTYCFYLWLVGEQRMFASVSVGDVEPHIPKEAGLGTWKSVEIPFNVFEKRFVPMEAII